MFKLGHLANQRFHYVACREAFDLMGGLWGWFIQRLGAYSLVRGAMDRASFTKTKELLASAGSKVVIFPEGEVYSQNDSLLPFQSGVVQLAFWGLEEAIKADPEADVVLLPVAVRYQFVQDMQAEIASSIARLEQAVGLTGHASDETYVRIRRIGELVVGKLEQQFEIKPSADEPLGERMQRVKLTQLERAAGIAKIKLKGGPLPEEMRSVINAVHRVANDPSGAKSTYDRRLWQEAKNHIEPAIHELDRLANWIAVYDGYVAADPSAERIVHLLIRMEKEVLGRAFIRGRQKAHVRLGDPISLRAHQSAYLDSKRETVSSLAKAGEDAVQALLIQIAKTSQAEM